MGEVFSDEEIRGIRSMTPGCHGERIHLNHCGSSLPDTRVLDVQVDHLHREAEIGGYEAAVEAEEAESAVYESLARLVGGRAHEIARMEHATDAWNAAFWSIPMRSGQRILTHEHDYGANFVAFARAREIHGVEIVVLPSDASGQLDLDALDLALAEPDRVALTSLAWVPTSGGLVNPAASVGARTRAAGVPLLVDACQAVGQLVVDVERIGCDFLSATGRKFLRGPRGTGFLWVREDVLDRVSVSQPDHHGFDWSLTEGVRPRPGARRFEHWEYAHAGWLGLGAAADVALELGIDRIEATIALRAEELRARLMAIGMDVRDQGEVKSGIVTATHPAVDAAALRAGLEGRRINVTTTHDDSARMDHESRGITSMLRLSVHCMTTVEELDEAAWALDELINDLR